ncbi:type IV toxin-antitoxin system AbiEi family antitoxin [Nesterenkonia sp. NBAIMH1]|uniref:type IV toxin-antitoxin system AbiEi family antitoxin n=1 Tax=Nesterenkonia sp. NBAIMH1 TaxID=2600320 RepID=UPI0011B4F7A4|nr:type IV toxin-antitoxin system AbiEi family antitoxin [Nesterenkonia sp. NBAIMH1]
MEILAEHLQNQLAGYDLELKTPQPLGLYKEYEFERAGQLIRGRQSEYVTAVYLPKMTLTALAHAIPPPVRRSAPVFAFGPRIMPRAADAFREDGINYLDEAGNAHIRFADVLIDVRGRIPKPSLKTSMRPGPQKTLFTPRRAQVIFALLTWPELLSAPLRDIAFYSGASTGQAHDTIKLLRERQFITNRNDDALTHRDELIDIWTSEYPSGLGSPTRERRFTGDPQHLVMDDDTVAYVSGEAAASEIRHLTLTLYTSAFNARIAAANRWKRTEADANIFVRPQFWLDPRRRSEEIPQGTVQRAPELLIYADLMASREPRQIQMAKELRHATSLQTPS